MSAARDRPMPDAWLHVLEGDGVLRVRWSGAAFEQIKTSFRSAFPPGEVTYSAEDRAWLVPCRHERRLIRWAARWFPEEAITWEQVIPDEPEDAPAARPQTLVELAHVLCLTPDAPAGLIEASRRWWAKELHPDRAGGDADAMTRVNSAADALLSLARR